MLYLTTCVGFEYGRQYLKLRGFSWKRSVNSFTTVVARLVSQNIGNRICLIPLPTHFHMDYQRHACLAFSVPPSQYCRYGNINPFPIDYAFLPRLRGRLTLP
jgi:hypothetical protein|uniref:Uncharacterized protein n=1 Tax=Daphnia magna TaxID=35525 RepID=A0A0P6E9T9_9CRUS